MVWMNLYMALCRLMARLGLPLHGAVMYIGGSDILPPPLSREEETRLMERLGDETCRDEVRSRLIEHNLRLVVYISRRFENTGVGDRATRSGPKERSPAVTDWARRASSIPQSTPTAR